MHHLNKGTTALFWIGLHGLLAFGLYKVLMVFIQLGVLYAFIVAGSHLFLMLFSYAFFLWSDHRYPGSGISFLALFSLGLNTLLI